MVNGKKIAIDARMIEMSGIGTYVQHLMGQGIYDVALGREEEIRRYDSTVEVIPYDAPIYKLREQLCFPNVALAKAGVELVHFPHYNVPITCKLPFVVTVHDLTHIILPEFLGSKVKFLYAKFLMKNALYGAKHIFTVSENSKKDICSHFGVAPEKISITYNAVDSDFRVKPKPELEYLYEKYRLPRDRRILLYVGNLKPHKNLARLLEALARMPEEKLCLILAGKAFISEELREKEQALGIADRVVHTGLVSKEELIDLYNLADLFVFPSLYEGFGIPPLEAMACGTPVVAADNSSIPEVVGDAAILFPAEDIGELARAIRESSDPEIARRLRDAGFERVGVFRWENAVVEVKQRIREIL